MAASRPAAIWAVTSAFSSALVDSPNSVTMLVSTGLPSSCGDLAADLGDDGAVRLDHRVQVGVEPQLVADHDRAVEDQFLVAVQHALHVDRHVELVEDLVLDPAAGDATKVSEAISASWPHSAAASSV